MLAHHLVECSPQYSRRWPRRLRPRDLYRLLRNSPLPDRFMRSGARVHDNSLFDKRPAPRRRSTWGCGKPTPLAGAVSRPARPQQPDRHRACLQFPKSFSLPLYPGGPTRPGTDVPPEFLPTPDGAGFPAGAGNRRGFQELLQAAAHASCQRNLEDGEARPASPGPLRSGSRRG